MLFCLCCLHQEGYVSTLVCVVVGGFVSRITQKLLNRFTDGELVSAQNIPSLTLPEKAFFHISIDFSETNTWVLMKKKSCLLYLQSTRSTDCVRAPTTWTCTLRSSGSTMNMWRSCQTLQALFPTTHRKCFGPSHRPNHVFYMQRINKNNSGCLIFPL